MPASHCVSRRAGTLFGPAFIAKGASEATTMLDRVRYPSRLHVAGRARNGHFAAVVPDGRPTTHQLFLHAMTASLPASKPPNQPPLIAARGANPLDGALRLLRGLFIWGGFAFLIIFGLLFLQRDSLKYLDWSEAVYQRFWPQRVGLAIHVLAASIALLVAPIQFSTRLRKRWPVFHRWTGWIYVACALVSAPVSFHLSFFSACTMCVPPFAIWSVLFLIVTVLAVLMALRRNFEAHRQFMIRSWVLMNGFVFVRLDTYLEFPLPTGPGVDRPAMLIWAVWVVPLIMTEMWLSWGPLITRTPRRAQVDRVA